MKLLDGIRVAQWQLEIANTTHKISLKFWSTPSHSRYHALYSNTPLFSALRPYLR